MVFASYARRYSRYIPQIAGAVSTAMNYPYPKRGPGGGKVKRRRKRARRVRKVQKTPMSYTMSQTKRKRKKYMKKSYNDPTAVGRFVCKVGRAMGNGRPTVTYRHQQQKIIDVHSTGVQGISDLYSVMNQRHIALINVNNNPGLAEVEESDWFTNIFGMNPDYNADGGPMTTGETGTAMRKNKLAFVKDIQGQLRFGNFSNNSAEITVFWVTVKKGNDFTIATDSKGSYPHIQDFVNQMYADNADSQMYTVGVAQRSVTQGPQGGFSTPGAPGYTPFTDPKFRRQFNLLKKIQFTLKGGESKKISKRLIYNRWFNYSDWTGASGSYGHTSEFSIPYCTVYCFAIVRGEPCLVTTDNLTEMISPGPFKIGVEINYSVDIGYSESRTAYKKVEYNNFNFVGTSDHTKVALINEETDQPAVYDEAGQ